MLLPLHIGKEINIDWNVLAIQMNDNEKLFYDINKIKDLLFDCLDSNKELKNKNKVKFNKEKENLI